MNSGSIDSVFQARTATIYDGMRSRARKLGREMPFDRAEFRAWVRAQFGAADRALQCGYCPCWLNVATFVVDHQTPLAAPWHGSLGIENLLICCAVCNRRKGKMSAHGFRLLTGWGSRELDSRDFADVLGRLALGGMSVRLRAAGRRAA